MPRVNGWIPILGVVAAALAVSVFPWAPSPVIHLTLILLALLIGAVFQGFAIPAAAFWRRFDLVHASTPRADRKVMLKVLVVHDQSSLAAAEEVKTHHASEDLEVVLQAIDSATTDPKTILPSDMDSADAVYFVWTEPLRRNTSVVKALEDWVWTHMDVPILVVNSENIPWDGPNLTVMAPWSTAPSALLLQVMSRTKMWVRLATRLHRWWIIATAASLFAVMALSVTGVELIITNKRLAERDEIVEPSFTLLATQLYGTRQLEQARPSSVMLRTDLSEIAKFVLNDIVRITHASSGPKDHISVFRKASESLLLQVDGPPDSAKPLPMGTIAGCALRTSSFILWDDGCKAGAPAAWDTSGTEIGWCGSKKNTVVLDTAHDNDVCTYKPVYPDLHNHGVLCFSPALLTSPNSTPSDTVVCLVSADTNAVFLRTRVARSKLSSFALVANSLPTNQLMPSQ